MNHKFLLWLSLTKHHIYIFGQQRKFIPVSLLNDWNYFWNKYCNYPFLAICRSWFPILIFLRHPDSKQRKLRCEWVCKKKKKKKNYFKGLYKTTCYKTKSIFSQFSFLIDCCMSVFFLLIKAFVNFEKLIRFHRQAFSVCKNGDNLKILI